MQEHFMLLVPILRQVEPRRTRKIRASRRPSTSSSRQRCCLASFPLCPDFLMSGASLPRGADVFVIQSYSRWRHSLSEVQSADSKKKNDFIKGPSWMERAGRQRWIPPETQWDRKCGCAGLTQHSGHVGIRSCQLVKTVRKQWGEAETRAAQLRFQGDIMSDLACVSYDFASRVVYMIKTNTKSWNWYMKTHYLSIKRIKNINSSSETIVPFLSLSIINKYHVYKHFIYKNWLFYLLQFDKI